jgi:hypothetical protein
VEAAPGKLVHSHWDISFNRGHSTFQPSICKLGEALLERGGNPEDGLIVNAVGKKTSAMKTVRGHARSAFNNI